MEKKETISMRLYYHSFVLRELNTCTDVFLTSLSITLHCITSGYIFVKVGVYQETRQVT